MDLEKLKLKHDNCITFIKKITSVLNKPGESREGLKDKIELLFLFDNQFGTKEFTERIMSCDKNQQMNLIDCVPNA
jgi:hypothetical protein